MFLFSDIEAESLRERSVNYQYILERLREKRGYLANNKPVIPKISKANWGSYYHCDLCAQRLEFDINSPHLHKCPSCGAEYSGEPYDSSWEINIHHANSKTAYSYGLLYMLTQKPEDAAVAEEILCGYAQNYLNYREHGDIPYNGPGLAHAQTLNEAKFLRELSYAYDLISNTLTSQQKNDIMENMFRIGAEFLIEHRTKQLHNHEVLINSQIAVLGLLLDDEKIISRGLYEDYGLLYQLKKGSTYDDMWFEGTFQYHEFALEAFMAFEIFARHTKYSNLADDKYLRMLCKPLELITEDGRHSALNDFLSMNEKVSPHLIYEFGYNYYKDKRLSDYLNIIYRYHKRDNTYSFLFGAAELPKSGDIKYENYYDALGSGLTVLRGKDMRYLLVKHSRFGGEHDHYDRLGLSFSAFGDNMCSDLGTVPYGTLYHYEYFKKTGTHNTVMVNEESQPPANCNVFEYSEKDGEIFLDCGTDWRGGYSPLDSFVIKQWDELSYENTCFRRRILWVEDYFIDIFSVNHPIERQTDWILHVDGQRQHVDGECQHEFIGKNITDFSSKKPFSFLTDVKMIEREGLIENTWKTQNGFFRLFTSLDCGKMYTAQGLNNPPNKKLDFVILRQNSKNCVFVNVFEAYKENPTIKDVKISLDAETANITINNKNYKISTSI